MLHRSIESIDALVLAGGRSTRMGQDKAQLMIQGDTLLSQCIQRLTMAGCGRVYVSGDYPQWRGIVDREPDLGPLGGIASALEVIDDDRWVLCWPVDVPVVQDLVSCFFSLRGQRVLWQVASIDASPLPLILYNSQSLQRSLSQYLTAGGRRVKGWVRQRRFTTLDYGASELTNLNTPREWQAYLASNRGRWQ